MSGIYAVCGHCGLGQIVPENEDPLVDAPYCGRCVQCRRWVYAWTKEAIMSERKEAVE